MRHSRTSIIFAVILSLATFPVAAQNLTDLLIGEVLVENTNGLTDGYGHRNGWIEIFNTSSGTVKFGGCYLSDDKSNLRKYHIPTSDLSTRLGPRQSIVFYADGDPSKGTYYTNFTLRGGSTIYLVSNDGRTVIDQVEIPADLPADHSIVRIPTGVKGMDFETRVSAKPTPGSYNGDVDAKTKSQVMKEQDPHGWVLTLIAVMVVFTALMILAFIFGWIGNANKRAQSGPKPLKVKKGEITPEVAAAISMALSQEYGSEVYAAIALALDDYLSGGVHDLESMVITIKPTPGSSWAVKTQNFRQLPR
ncbi:MAG: lamin tail domain-containing protein [Bacteroidales bacterium]|nr:lamin tail domain-containing protein [Bacteroidales bacterium]